VNLEEDDETLDNNSKENLSPAKTKQATKIEALVPAQESKSTVASTTSQKAAPKYKLEDALQISRKSVYFGQRFPGQVVEEHFDIVNKSQHDFVVQIIITCHNEDLQNTEEYVYSIRRQHLYDYNDKHYLIMAPYSCAAFKFALKVPNLKLSGKIRGQAEISIQGISGSYILDLTTDVAIPKIFCPKELKCNGLDYKVIKLAIREGKKQESKVPFRNNGNVPVTLELDFYEPKGTQEKHLFDCLVHPNVITIGPNSTAIASIIVKPWKVMMGLKGTEKSKPARKILTGRVRDSALIYSFVFWIEIY